MKNNIVSKKNIELFIEYCKNDNLDGIKNLYSNTDYNNWIFDILNKNDIYFDEDIICFLARYGYLEVAKYIYSIDKDKINLYQKNNEPIVLACQEKNIDFVKWLYNLTPDIDIFTDNIILCSASTNEHTDILLWYIQSLSFENNLKNDDKIDGINLLFDYLSLYNKLDIYIDAINIFDLNIEVQLKKNIKNTFKNNNSCIMNYLLDKVDISPYIDIIYYHSCKINNLYAIKYLINNNYTELISFQNIYTTAFYSNSIEICEYIETIYPEEIRNVNGYTIINNMDFTYIELKTLKYFYTILSNYNSNINKHLIVQIIMLLCSVNKLNEAKYTRNFFMIDDFDLSNNDIIFYLDNILIQYNIELLEWVMDRLNINKKRLYEDYLSINLLDKIILNRFDNKADKLEFIKYLFKERKLIKFYRDKLNSKIIYKSLTNLDSNIINFLYEENNNILENGNGLLIKLCYINKFDIFNWYLTKRSIYSKENIYFYLLQSCKAGNVDIAKYMYYRYELNITKYHYIRAFRQCFISGNVILIIWFYSLWNKYLSSKFKISLEREWINICKNNNVQLIRFILENPNIKINLADGFNTVCSYGLLNLAKNMYNINNNLRVSNNVIVDMFTNGYIHLINWYLTISDIDISILNNNIIRTILIRGMTDTFNIILKINPNTNIRGLNDGIYRVMCNVGNTYMVRYLATQYDFYDYKFRDNEIIPIIKDSPEYYYEKKEFFKLIEYYNLKQIDKDDKTYKFDNLNELCGICYENDCKITTNCNHNYCVECLFKWYIFKNTNCPFCREDLNLKDSTYIK